MQCSTASHEALKSSPLWGSLDFVGVQVVEADEDEPEVRYELRNCSCGSTLCKQL